MITSVMQTALTEMCMVCLNDAIKVLFDAGHIEDIEKSKKLLTDKGISIILETGKKKKGNVKSDKLKKVPSGYNLFIKATMPDVMVKLTKIKEDTGENKKPLSEVAQMWSSLSDDKKKEWNDKSAQMKECNRESNSYDDITYGSNVDEFTDEEIEIMPEVVEVEDDNDADEPLIIDPTVVVVEKEEKKTARAEKKAKKDAKEAKKDAKEAKKDAKEAKRIEKEAKKAMKAENESENKSKKEEKTLVKKVTIDDSKPRNDDEHHCVIDIEAIESDYSDDDSD